MSKNTPKQVRDTEYDAMREWAKLVDAGKAPVFKPTGVPVRDGQNLGKKNFKT